MTGLFDPGLQPERTELSWRRTALTLAVGSAVAMRLLPTALSNAWWVLPGMLGLVASGAVWMASRSRLRRVNDVLLSSSAPRLPGAQLLLAMTLVATVIAALGLVVVLVGADVSRGLSGLLPPASTVGR